jgi:hypothetical protein
MKRILSVVVVAVGALALAAAVTAHPKPKPKHKPKPHAAVFDKGCWKGTGKFEYTSEENGTTVEFHKGAVTFTLNVTKAGTATGFMDVTAHGSADIPSVNASGEVNITGEFSLNGTGKHVVADGTYHIAGSVISSGFEVPVAWDVDATGPFTIKSAKATTAVGSWGDQIDWTAKRVSATCIT